MRLPAMTYWRKIKKSGTPVIMLVNKADLSKGNEAELLCEKYQKEFPGWTVLPVSALMGYNIDKVLNRILELLPELRHFSQKMILPTSL